VQRSHGRSAVSEAEDKRSASSFVMGLPPGQGECASMARHTNILFSEPGRNPAAWV
jgi:hypothetical protein